MKSLKNTNQGQIEVQVDCKVFGECMDEAAVNHTNERQQMEIFEAKRTEINDLMNQLLKIPAENNDTEEYPDLSNQISLLHLHFDEESKLDKEPITADLDQEGTSTNPSNSSNNRNENNDPNHNNNFNLLNHENINDNINNKNGCNQNQKQSKRLRYNLDFGLISLRSFSIF